MAVYYLVAVVVYGSFAAAFAYPNPVDMRALCAVLGALMCFAGLEGIRAAMLSQYASGIYGNQRVYKVVSIVLALILVSLLALLGYTVFTK